MTATLPYSIEAEEAILAAMIDKREFCLLALQELTPQDFYRPIHADYFIVIRDLVEQEVSINSVTIAEQAKATWVENADTAAEYLQNLLIMADYAPVETAVQSYIDILIDRRKRRDIMAAGQAMIDHAADVNNPDPLAYAVASIEACAKATTKTVWRSALDITKSIGDSWGATNKVIPYGISQLDKIVGGITIGIPELTIWGARSSHGKTAFARKTALNFAYQGYTVAFFSQETIGEVILEDMAATMCGVNLYRLKHGGYRGDEAVEAYARLSDAMEVLRHHGSKLQFLDTAVTLPEIYIKAKEKVKEFADTEHPIGVIIIDFVQLIDSGVKCRDIRSEMVVVMKKLHELTRTTSVPVVALSQVTMKSEDRDKHVRRENLAESPGVIVNLADKIIMINSPFREDERTKPRPVFFYVDKFKRGSTGKAGCLFYPTIQRFADYDEAVTYDE